MKERSESLLSLAEALLKDAEATYPEDSRNFERDLSRLKKIFEGRGNRVFLLELPALAKHLQRCVSEGAYTRSGLPHGSFKSPTVKLPRLFVTLYQRIFEDDGMLRNIVDTTALFYLTEVLSFGKKVQFACEPSATYSTIAEFYGIDERLPLPTNSWAEQDWLGIDGLHLSDPRCYRADRRDEPATGLSCPAALIDVCQRVFDVMSVTLGSFDPYAYTPRHGPGVVSDLSRRDFKYDFPSWSDRLESVFPFSDFGAMPNWGLWNIDDPEIEYKDEASRLICVPKTFKGPRLIAAEPVAHQWCQQVIWDFVDSQAKTTWIGRFIHFRDQTYNQAMAIEASTDGNKWTIDLSSASDRVSCWLVERAFRRNPSFLKALWSSRTSHITQDLDKKSPRDYYLRKFSTMGSACTFPIESLIFLGVCIAGTLYSRGVSRVTTRAIEELVGSLLVFGDDLIVESGAGQDVETLLTYLDFKVNPDKTFRTGRFRESCGVDAFQGEDITPAYVRRTLDDSTPDGVVSSVESSNNFWKKGCWRTADLIKTAVANARIAVVSASSGVFGWTSFCGADPSTKKRWNKSLQRLETKIAVPTASQTRHPIDKWSALLQYFTERPSPDTNWASGAGQKPALKLTSRWVDMALLGLR